MFSLIKREHVQYSRDTLHLKGPEKITHGRILIINGNVEI